MTFLLIMIIVIGIALTAGSAATKAKTAIFVTAGKRPTEAGAVTKANYLAAAGNIVGAAATVPDFATAPIDTFLTSPVTAPDMATTNVATLGTVFALQPYQRLWLIRFHHL